MACPPELGLDKCNRNTHDSCRRDRGSASAAGAMKIEYWCGAFFHAETIIEVMMLGYRLVKVRFSYVFAR